MHGGPHPARGATWLRRRGRAVVGSLVLAWVISQFGLSRAIDRNLWLRDPMFADKREKFRQRVIGRTTAAGRPISVAIVGSSRTCFAVRGDVVEDRLGLRNGRQVAAVNVGIPSAGPVTNLLSVHRLVNSNDQPDVLVIEVLPPLLADVGPAPVEFGRLPAERLQRDELDLVRSCGFPESIAADWRTADLLPWYCERFSLLGRAAAPWLPWNLRSSIGRDSDANGWIPSICQNPTAAEYRRGVERARAEYHTLLQFLRPNSPAFGALRQSARICRDNGVSGALLLMPEGTDFRSWYPPQAEAELYAALNRLCVDTGLRLIDARRWLGDDSFSDSHHLIPRAAGPFSERLGREIEALVPAIQFER
jgi:hypothetical protein